MSGASSGRRPGIGQAHEMTVRLDGFAWEAIEQESARTGVPIEDLVGFAVVYYLADLDSGRIARHITRAPYPTESAS
jgi:hypothetical protein